MRLLLACIPAPGCRYLEDWKSSLARHCEVVHDHEEFWAGSGSFDIVHVHWPEYLSWDIEHGLTGRLDRAILPRLQRRILLWRARNAKIVVTRHNTLPHNNTDPAFGDLYEMVYANADAVVHMGRTSSEEYRERYEGRFACDRQVHARIPHGNLVSYLNTVSMQHARRALGVRCDSRTVLAFGGFAAEQEASLVMDAFRALPGWNKTLLAPTWFERLPQTSNIRLKYWVRDLRRWYGRSHPWYRLGHAFVPDDRVQLYLNACDVLFVQRWRPLNSSNLALGFSFGRVVVGPNCGNVGEILRAAGNPTFEPGNPASAAGALRVGLEMARAGAGARNREIALTEWDVSRMAARHMELYVGLIRASNLSGRIDATPSEPRTVKTGPA